MIDSTNPRIMADNIRHLSGEAESQASDISTLQTEVEALGSYSTNEVDTGMKLGNDNIYRKIFEVELPNNTTKTFAHGISNLNKVIRFEGVVQYTSAISGRQIATATSGFNSMTYTDSNITMVSNTDLSGTTGVIIMEYTKAAPEALISPAPDDTRFIEPEVREEDPIEEPVVEVKKTTRKKSTN